MKFVEILIMCLSSIKQTYKPNNEIHIGYKIFRKNKTTYSSILKHNHNRGYSLNKWYKNTEKRKIASTEYDYNKSDYAKYDSSFHILTDLEQAKDYFEKQQISNTRLVQVQYKYRAASGTDSRRKCDIAQYMKLIKEISYEDTYSLSIEPQASFETKLKCNLATLNDDIKIVLYHKNKKIKELEYNVYYD